MENKRIFESPEIEIVKIEADDVIATSGFGGEWDDLNW